MKIYYSIRYYNEGIKRCMENINCLRIRNYNDYKILIENIQNLCLNKKPLVVIPKLVSRSDEEEIAFNIANTLSLNINKVLIIHCNPRNLNIYKQLNILNNFGLYEVLRENINPENIITNIGNNLDILTFGTKIVDLTEPKIFKKMKETLYYLKKFYDYIVIDMPETFLEYNNILENIGGIIFIGKEDV